MCITLAKTTGDNMSDDIWHLHLLHQDKLDDPNDVSIYTFDDAFVAAKKVLDLGTGYGHHLAALAQLFPDKQFTGVDKDVDAIHFAKTHYDYANLDFIQIDIEQVDFPLQVGKQDYVIARLLLQHLHSVRQFAYQVADILQAKGGLLLIDVHEPSKRFLPEMPDYTRIFQHFRQQQLQQRNHEELLALPLMLKQAGLVIRSEIIVAKNTDSHYQRQDLLQMLATNLDVLQQIYQIAGDYAAAKQQLAQWAAANNAYGSLGEYQLRARKP